MGTTIIFPRVLQHLVRTNGTRKLKHPLLIPLSISRLLGRLSHLKQPRPKAKHKHRHRACHRAITTSSSQTSKQWQMGGISPHNRPAHHSILMHTTIPQTNTKFPITLTKDGVRIKVKVKDKGSNKVRCLMGWEWGWVSDRIRRIKQTSLDSA